MSGRSSPFVEDQVGLDAAIGDEHLPLELRKLVRCASHPLSPWVLIAAAIAAIGDAAGGETCDEFNRSGDSGHMVKLQVT